MAESTRFGERSGQALPDVRESRLDERGTPRPSSRNPEPGNRSTREPRIEANTEPGRRVVVRDTSRLGPEAAGALAGLHVGEVLGAYGQGRRSAEAAATLQSAFPDLSAPGPAARRVAFLVRDSVPPEEPLAPSAGAPGVPEWVAVAVAAGIALGSDPVEQLAREVAQRLEPTRHNRLERAATAAIAAAVSAAVDHANWAQCLSLAVSAADAVEQAELESSEPWAPGPSVSARLSWAHALATRSGDDPMAGVELLVGTSETPQESIPAAFAVVGVLVGQAVAAEPLNGSLAAAQSRMRATHRVDPVEAARRAAALGGGAYVTAAVAGALAGALAGVEAIPAHMRAGLSA